MWYSSGDSCDKGDDKGDDDVGRRSYAPEVDGLFDDDVSYIGVITVVTFLLTNCVILNIITRVTGGNRVSARKVPSSCFGGFPSRLLICPVSDYDDGCVEWRELRRRPRRVTQVDLNHFSSQCCSSIIVMAWKGREEFEELLTRCKRLVVMDERKFLQ